MHKLFDSEDQSYDSGVVVVCGTYVSNAVGLEEVLVTGGYVGHALFSVGILAALMVPGPRNKALGIKNKQIMKSL